jgi:hypothetical protein
VQEEDIRQGRRPFTLTVPVLFYHGTLPWKIPPLREQHGPLPESLAGNLPHFDICCINLRELSDDKIRELSNAMLLQRVLLAFKHAFDMEFWRENSREVFIFIGENLPPMSLSRASSAPLGSIFSQQLNSKRTKWHT